MTDIPALPPKVAEAVVKVMGDVGYVQKKGVNSFHNYKFAAVGDVLAKIQPAMHEAGLLIAQDEVGHEVLADAAMTATYQFVLSHASGETWQHFPRHTGMAALRTQKGSIDDKALNKCHTAARKYFLLALFQIPTGEAVDPDMDGDVPDKSGGTKIVRPTLAPSPVDKQNAAQSRADVAPEATSSAGEPPAHSPEFSEIAVQCMERFDLVDDADGYRAAQKFAVEHQKKLTAEEKKALNELSRRVGARLREAA